MVSLGKEKQQGRFQSLTADAGRFELVVRGALPACLEAANRAVRRGNREEARDHLGAAQLTQINTLLDSDPGRTDIMFILAKLFLDLEEVEKAEHWFRRILDRESQPDVHHSLSEILFRDEHRWTEAARYSRQALGADPENVVFRIHWAHSLVRTGQVQEGLREYREVMRENTDLPGGVYTTYLWYSQYLPDMTREQIDEGYGAWARRFAPLEKARTLHGNDRDPERRLRIGYISPDFRRHAVNAFFEPVLDGHDRHQVEVYGYGQVRHPDRTTARLKSKFDVYRNITDRDATSVATLIEQDKIDILIELAGHVTDCRLDVLALKPAPVQVDFGGISTTGMPQVDYRVTDAVYDPPRTCGHSVEECVYLPGGLSCFRPPSESPGVAPLPAQRQGFFTFGSLNNHLKISPLILELWMRLLQDVPSARMVFKFYAAADSDFREAFLRKFEAQGISPDRIRVLGMLPYTEHMRLLNQIDMLLDTFPYNGGITTLEGLWMGVPTLTLTGERFVSRAGLSILSRVGLETFSAGTPDEYVQKAKAFATQIQELAQIRSALRPMMLHSALCRPDRITRELETAYRQMWRSWSLT